MQTQTQTQTQTDTDTFNTSPPVLVSIGCDVAWIASAVSFRGSVTEEGVDQDGERSLSQSEVHFHRTSPGL